MNKPAAAIPRYKPVWKDAPELNRLYPAAVFFEPTWRWGSVVVRRGGATIARTSRM